MIEEYKRWEIRHNSFAFWRDDQLIATSPDYDVDCDQDGFFVCNGEILTAATIEELRTLIDEHIESCDELPTNLGSSS
jgi:hypothetical protein